MKKNIEAFDELRNDFKRNILYEILYENCVKKGLSKSEIFKTLYPNSVKSENELHSLKKLLWATYEKLYI